jgi:hypothetical protein
MTFDYTQCENQTPSLSLTQLNLVDMPNFNYRLRSKDAKAQHTTPQFAFISNSSNLDVTQRQRCVIQFDVPADMDNTVFLYYKLTNFFQNHRRYVKSLDSDQLKGKAVSPSDLDGGDCKPVDTIDGKAIYPCGLIANSLFNGSSAF